MKKVLPSSWEKPTRSFWSLSIIYYVVHCGRNFCNIWYYLFHVIIFLIVGCMLSFVIMQTLSFWRINTVGWCFQFAINIYFIICGWEGGLYVMICVVLWIQTIFFIFGFRLGTWFSDQFGYGSFRLWIRSDCVLIRIWVKINPEDSVKSEIS